MDEIYCGVDGNAWITDKMVQSDSNFICFSKKVFGIIQDEEKEMNVNGMDEDDMDQDHDKQQHKSEKENVDDMYNGINDQNYNSSGFRFNIQPQNDNSNKTNTGGLSQFKF